LATGGGAAGAAGISEGFFGRWRGDRGPSSPSTAGAAGADLAALHYHLLSLGPPATLPRQIDRLAGKIRHAAASVDPDLANALALLPVDARSYRLCHGDLHPANVLIASAGPVVIDWFAASRGAPCLDVARTSLLLGDLGIRMIRPVHLPRATLEILEALYDAYRRGILRRTGFTAADVDRHRPPTLAARL